MNFVKNSNTVIENKAFSYAVWEKPSNEYPKEWDEPAAHSFGCGACHQNPY